MLQGKAIVLGRVLLLTNLQLSFVYRHRETFNSLTTSGTSQSSLAVVVLSHTLAIAIPSGIVGVGLAVPSLGKINELVALVVGSWASYQ